MQALTTEEVAQARRAMHPRYVGPSEGSLLHGYGADIRAGLTRLRPDLCPACTEAVADQESHRPLLHGCPTWEGPRAPGRRFCPVDSLQARAVETPSLLGPLADEAEALAVDAYRRAWELEQERDRLVLEVAGRAPVPHEQEAQAPGLAPLGELWADGLAPEEHRLLARLASLTHYEGRVVVAEAQMATLRRLQAGEVTEAEAMAEIHGRPLALAEWARTCAARLRGLRPGQLAALEGVALRQARPLGELVRVAQGMDGAQLHAWLGGMAS